MRIQLSRLPAWIINLNRSHDRWQKCTRSLSLAFPAKNLTRIAAIDGLDFVSRSGDGGLTWDPALLTRLQNEGILAKTKVLDPVRTALCMSHQRALQEFLKSGHPWGLIFEDDVRIADAMAHVAAGGGSIHPPDDAEMLFLHDRVKGREQPSGVAPGPDASGLRWRKVYGGIGLEAYAVTPAAARKILQAWSPVAIECDLQLLTFMDSYDDLEERRKVVQAMNIPSHATSFRIKAYCGHRPLFQTDQHSPSVKLATIQVASCPMDAQSAEPAGLCHEPWCEGTASQGIVLCASPKYSKMALEALASIREVSPSIPVYLHPAVEGIASRNTKLSMDLWSPFQETLYLDCDVMVCEDLMPVFELLKQADMYMARETPKHTNVGELVRSSWLARETDAEYLEVLKGLPDATPLWNSGVILFKKCSRTHGFFDLWRRRWKDRGSRTPDQLPLTEIVVEVGHPAELPGYWHCQLSWQNPGARVDKAAIYHFMGSRKQATWARWQNARGGAPPVWQPP